MADEEMRESPQVPVMTLPDALVAAAAAGQTDGVRQLIDDGCSPDTPSSQGDVPLVAAARGGHMATVTLLLAQGARPSQQGLQGYCALAAAAQAGHEEVVRLLLESCPAVLPVEIAELAWEVTAAGLTVLQVACLHDRPQILRLLLDHLSSDLDVLFSNPVGGTDEDARKTRDVAVEAQEGLGRCIWEALFAAVAAGSLSCLELLLDHVGALDRFTDYLREDCCLREPYLEEARMRLSFLLDPGVVGEHRLATFAFLMNSRKQRGATRGADFWPVHAAAVMGDPAILQALLDSGYANKDEATGEGFTPLMLAAAVDSVECVRVLLAAGASIDARNSQGRTALFTAAVGGHQASLQVLITYGADVNAVEAHKLFSPLRMSISRAAQQEAQAKQQAEVQEDPFLSCSALLIAGGADVNLACHDGTTPLHAAAAAGSVTCLALLLKSGAEVDALDGRGCTPLVAAAEHGQAASVMMLLTKGALIPKGQEACIMQSLAALRPTVWDMMDFINQEQLEALTTVRAFYDLPHPPAPDKPLPAAALTAALAVASQGLQDLTHSESAEHNLVCGRRPAYLFELLLRAAALPSAHGGVRAAVVGSQQLAAAAGLWSFAVSLFQSESLQYAAALSRCSNLPAGKREQRAFRLGNLLLAFHNLSALLRALHLPFSSLLDGSAAASASGSCARGSGEAGPFSPPWPGAGRSGSEDPGIAAVLCRREDVERLVASIQDECLLSSWRFVLDYEEAVSLPTKQRLLQGHIKAYSCSPAAPTVALRLTRGQSALPALAELCGLRGSGLLPAAAKLSVDFVGENGRGDGVAREALRLIAQELLDPGSGLFSSQDGGETYQPSEAACLGEGMSCWAGGAGFELVGSLLGMALVQGFVLPGFHLAGHIWRALLSCTPAQQYASTAAAAAAAAAAEALPPEAEAVAEAELWEDLQARDPAFCRSLQLLEGMGAEVAGLGLCFATECRYGGRPVELCQGGAEVPVTAENLGHYVRLMACHKLRGDAAWDRAQDMRRGFWGALPLDVLDTLHKGFTVDELNQLVGGQRDISLDDWQAHARYESGCCALTPQVVWLWDTVGGLPQQQRRALLAFVTGSTVLPAGGAAHLAGFNGAPHAFTVSVVAVEGDERLPRASTCFNHLFLPRYTSREVLAAQLGKALAGVHVFDEAVVRRGGGNHHTG